MKDIYEKMKKEYIEQKKNKELDLEKIELDIINYLECKSHGILIIDDDWGVGKTYTVKNILEDHKYSLNNIKYYSLLNIEKINDNLSLKSYIIDNTILIGTKDFVSILFNEKLKIKMSSVMRKFYLWMYNITSSLLDVFFNYKEKDHNVINGLRNIIKDKIILSDSFVLVIDEIERKKNELSLKNLFLKLIDLQENENVKIILVMNSKNLKKEDLDTLHEWHEKLIFKKIKFNLDPAGRINKLKKIEEIKIILDIIQMKVSGRNNLFYKYLHNIRNLKSAVIFLKCVYEIIDNNIENKIISNADILIRNILIENLLLHYLSYFNSDKIKYPDSCIIYEAIADNIDYNNEKLNTYIVNSLNISKEDFEIKFGIKKSKEIEIIHPSVSNFKNNFTEYLINSKLSENKNLLIHNDNIYICYKEFKSLICYDFSSLWINKGKILFFKLKNNNKIINFDYEEEKNHFMLISLFEFFILLLKEKNKYSLEYLKIDDNNLTILIIEIIKSSRNDMKTIKNSLKNIREDVFVRRIIREVEYEYGKLINELNKNFILNATLNANIFIVKYKMRLNHEKFNIISELIESNEYYDEYNIIDLIFKIKRIDQDIIEKIENLLIKSEIDRDVYKKIKKALLTIKNNQSNNIINFINYKELEIEELDKNYFSNDKINEDLKYLNLFKSYNK